MKLALLVFAAISALVANGSQAADKPLGVVLTSKFGGESADFTRLLYFQEIGAIRSTFKGEALSGKNYQLVLYEYQDGAQKSREVFFDSSESEYFRIGGGELDFYTFAQRLPSSEVKIEVQFPGFSKSVSKAAAPEESGFALKDFTAGREISDVELGKELPLVTYIMPYTKSDGSTQYCEVVQSGVSPHALGLKYKIRKYYLITIKIH